MNDIIYNIYCDESCHLENDGLNVMLLGCAWCKKDKSARYAADVQDIQRKHKAFGEIKWSKVSMSKKIFYNDIVEWFFAQEELFFRVVVVEKKNLLRHDIFNNGSHDLFYYKMYFLLLSKILNNGNLYNIYLDIKDTRSRHKIAKLREVLCNNARDGEMQMIPHIQNIHSSESRIMQVADFLMGAVAYKQRGLSGNIAKVEIINAIERCSHRNLAHSTPMLEKKFNIFIFTPQMEEQNA